MEIFFHSVAVFPTNLLRYLLLKGAAEEAMKIWLGQTISTKIGLSELNI